MAHVLDTLKERGFIAQVTYEDDLYKQLERTDGVLHQV